MFEREAFIRLKSQLAAEERKSATLTLERNALARELGRRQVAPGAVTGQEAALLLPDIEQDEQDELRKERDTLVGKVAELSSELAALSAERGEREPVLSDEESEAAVALLREQENQLTEQWKLLQEQEKQLLSLKEALLPFARAYHPKLEPTVAGGEPLGASYERFGEIPLACVEGKTYSVLPRDFRRAAELLGVPIPALASDSTPRAALSRGTTRSDVRPARVGKRAKLTVKDIEVGARLVKRRDDGKVAETVIVAEVGKGVVKVSEKTGTGYETREINVEALLSYELAPL